MTPTTALMSREMTRTTRDTTTKGATKSVINIQKDTFSYIFPLVRIRHSLFVVFHKTGPHCRRSFPHPIYSINRQKLRYSWKVCRHQAALERNSCHCSLYWGTDTLSIFSASSRISRQETSTCKLMYSLYYRVNTELSTTYLS